MMEQYLAQPSPEKTLRRSRPKGRRRKLKRKACARQRLAFSWVGSSKKLPLIATSEVSWIQPKSWWRGHRDNSPWFSDYSMLNWSTVNRFLDEGSRILAELFDRQ